jgi:hypothetical protein
MATRKRSRTYRPMKQPSGFTSGNLTNLAAIPLLTGIITLAGWYYVTSYRLDRSDIALATVNKLVIDKTAEDTAARSKIRDDFLASQVKTAEGIAKLDTRLAVAETNQKTANDTLSKIADTLQKITAIPASR